jgi:hypothetical protein
MQQCLARALRRDARRRRSRLEAMRRPMVAAWSQVQREQPTRPRDRLGLQQAP